MSNLLLPRRFYNQPQGAVAIDWSHPLLNQCIALQVFAPNLWNPTLELKGVVGTIAASGAQYITDPEGAGLFLPQNGYWQMSPTWNRSAITNQLTSALVYKFISDANSASQFVLGDTLANGAGGVTYNWGHYFANTTNSHTFYIHNGTTGVNTPLVPYVAGRVHKLVGTYNGSTVASYFDGLKNTAAQTGNVQALSADFALAANGWSNIAPQVSGVYYLHCLLNRCWSDSEALSFTHNPWQIFKVSE
jgi:hypothetical protein